MGQARDLPLPGPRSIKQPPLLRNQPSLRPFLTALLAFFIPSTRACADSSVVAQLSVPDPAHFTNWLLSAAAALSIAALGKQFIRKTPLEAQFLTRREFAEFRDKLDQDLSAISAKIDRSHDLLAHRLDGLSARFDEVRSLVDRVDERTRHRAGTRSNDK
jgi:hypothetical protein